jgi:dolichol kinase
MTARDKKDRLRPLRKLIHLGGAVFALIYLVTSRRLVLTLALIGLLGLIAVEGARQRWPAAEELFEAFIGPALRQGEERRPTTGLWSMLGIIVALVAFPKAIAIPAILFAQVGDPAAEVFGRRWGRYKFGTGKSLAGSLGCFLASVAAGLGSAVILPVPVIAVVAGAFVATLVEALPLPIGDNLWMAPLSGLAMALVA